MAIDDTCFPKPIWKQVNGKTKSCRGLGWKLLRCLLLVVIGNVTVSGVVCAAGQDSGSVNSNDVEVQEAQQTRQLAVEPPVVPASDATVESPALADRTTETHLSAEPIGEYWQQRVDELVKEINLGSKTSEDADELYEKISRQLRIMGNALRVALRWAHSPIARIDQSTLPTDKGNRSKLKWSQPETVEDVYQGMVSLYQIRISLLQSISPELNAQITGVGKAGKDNFNGEMKFMLLYLRFHSMAVPQLAPILLEQLTEAPLPIIWDLLKLILIVTLFRWWRQWAPQGLIELRSDIMQILSRSKLSLRLARLVWYLQEVRSPLEWLFLMTAFFHIMAVPSLAVIEDFVQIIIRALLYAWLAVRFINAIASRGVAGLSDDTSDLRLRSLKLVAGWFLMLGLGLKLTETYTGQGTIYSLLWILFQVLSVPIAILLLTWWRAAVKQKLTELHGLPNWAAKTIEKRRGLRGYINTFLGACYLVFILFRQFGIRQLSRFESGREIVVTLIGREIYREQEKKAQTLGGKPVGTEVLEKLLSNEHPLASKVFSKQFKQLSEIVEFGHGGIVAITGERGAGKSVLLHRLVEKFQDKAIVIECTTQGFDGVKQALAEKLSTPKEQLDSHRLAELADERGIRSLAFDNLHLLARPKVNGVVELNRLVEFLAPLRSRVKICLIVTMVKQAFQYLIRLRAEQIMLKDYIELPSWTQEQITELIETRSRWAGIEPDFSEIDIPLQFDDVEYESLDERTRAGFYRILWSVSGGNPSVALRLWGDSLAVTDDERIIVQVLPQVFASDQLEQANLSVLLMLRVIIQSEMSTTEDIAESLQLSPGVIDSGIRFALLRDWIQETGGYYEITWRWFRPINRVLTRQNLLSR